ncbi:MAG: hypothetical protein ACM3O4_02045 [Ignavibacteriales bacterium]
MSKIMVQTSLRNPEEINDIVHNLEGIKKRNELIYKEDNTDVLIRIEDVVTIIRKNEDSELTLILDVTNETIGTYFIKGVGNLEIKIKTNILKITNNSIYTEYELVINNEEIGLFTFETRFEEIE